MLIVRVIVMKILVMVMAVAMMMMMMVMMICDGDDDDDDDSTDEAANPVDGGPRVVSRRRPRQRLAAHSRGAAEEVEPAAT